MSRIALGGAGFSIRDTRDDDAAIATIRTAYEHGIRQFDSSRAYATVDDPTHNESLFRRALDGHRDVVIATKGGHFRIDHDTWGADGSPTALRRNCEDSLVALNCDALPLYYLHKVDPDTPLEDSVGALAELRAEGKILDIGVCNVTADQLARAMAVAPIVAVQNKFSPFQSADRSVLRAAEMAGIAHYGYSPLGGSKDRARLPGELPQSVQLAAALGVSFQRLILDWLLSVSEAMIVITGAGRPETAIDSSAATDVELLPAAIAVITAEVSGLFTAVEV